MGSLLEISSLRTGRSTCSVPRNRNFKREIIPREYHTSEASGSGSRQGYRDLSKHVIIHRLLHVSSPALEKSLGILLQYTSNSEHEWSEVIDR